MMKTTTKASEANMQLTKPRDSCILVAKNGDKIESGKELVLYRADLEKKPPPPLELHDSSQPSKRVRVKS